MKFIVNSQVLLKNLQSISGCVSTNSTMPILDNFLFELNESSLTVTASDLETTMMVEITLEDVSELDDIRKVAVPAKFLLEMLKTLPDIPMIFNINTQNFGIELSTGDGKYKLNGVNGAEYPTITLPEDTVKTTLSSSLLANAITKTIFAAGNDEMRPTMSGIYCILTPDDITFVGTDAHKLVRYKRTDYKSDVSADFILAKKPLNQLKGILSSKKEDISVDMEYNRTNVCFTFENYRLICRLIDGKYPNYEAVIPKENPNQLTVDRQAFLQSIRRVSIFANQSTQQIRLKMQDGELLISAEDFDYSNEAKERLACRFEGDDMEIGFSSKYLIEMLGNVDTENINLRMSHPNRAGLILPAESNNADEDILMLVMPVMLNA